MLLDEFSEFKKTCIEGLREPMENHNIAISRVGKQYVFPSDFMVVATTNPCPCGNYPDRTKCKCTVSQRIHYRKKVSRPVLERFDMILWAEPVAFEDFDDDSIDSDTISKRILYGRNRQKLRYEKESFSYNSRIPNDKIDEVCNFDDDTKTFMKTIFQQKELSMREFYHMLKVSRTIADLSGEEQISIEHVAEAASFYNRGMELE